MSGVHLSTVRNIAHLVMHSNFNVKAKIEYEHGYTYFEGEEGPRRLLHISVLQEDTSVLFGCRDPRCLDLGTRWRWVVSYLSLPIYQQGKRPRYPVEWKWSEVKILDPTGTRPLTRSSQQPVAILTVLLQIKGSWVQDEIIRANSQWNESRLFLPV
jgi:hypothetical protein